MIVFIAAGDVAAADDAPDYRKQIKPLFARHCTSCHGALEEQGGLRLDASPLIRKGGDSGKAIVAGDAAGSLLIERIASADESTRMPPADAGFAALSADEIELIRRWIDGGAIAPDEPIPADPRRHWAFQSPVRPTIPPLDSPHPIDAFIAARLREETLTSVPAADRVTLLRRLSFDLTGLPPAPDEIAAFVADDSPDACERLTDRLLASPHFGERWGRGWMDLARYADTDGYSGEQYRPWAWRWRDWVIDSLNADLPFDEFTIHQLAGDLLPEAGVEERVATGFYRNALHSREMDADPEEFRVRKIVDYVNVTGATWLGLTIGCAQCHSHKFDPVSHAEYFGLYAFFNSTGEADVAAPLRGDAAAFAKASLLLAAQTPGESPQTMAAVITEDIERRKTQIHLRGDFLSPGDEVQPHTPAVLPRLTTDQELPSRLDLAKWLMTADHPLTARVAVNRIWQSLFGRGLVRTENDFGTQGAPPTHPELLDWLAIEFPRRGWSQKQMIRQIVASAAYRRMAVLTPELAAHDPENRLLARQNRLRHDAEILRDAALAAAGLLDDRVGGPSFRPAVPADAGNVVNHRWKSEPTPDRYRRGLYIVVQRNVQLPFLMTFDAPDGNTFCTRRERSNTPPQALTLLNDPFFFECASQLAKRLVAEQQSDSDRLQSAFVACLARGPTDDEQADLMRYLGDQRRLLPDANDELSLWTGVARVLMNTDEFLCRE
jgi:mono/diheme cytochrome c family protein